MEQRNEKAQRARTGALSRRSLLRAAALLAAGALGTGAARASRAEARLPQDQVSYQNAPKGDKRCKDCVNFEGQNSCRVVAGTISPDGWCRLWNARRLG
ncbi:MAG: hypothetical protein JNM75_03255 [Rhodospirillales bacterium]|nr:hypothetical protein [Rhodospirillales bacterium]